MLDITETNKQTVEGHNGGMLHLSQSVDLLHLAPMSNTPQSSQFVGDKSALSYQLNRNRKRMIGEDDDESSVDESFHLRKLRIKNKKKWPLWTAILILVFGTAIGLLVIAMLCGQYFLYLKYQEGIQMAG